MQIAAGEFDVRATQTLRREMTWHYTDPTRREGSKDRSSGDVPVHQARTGGADGDTECPQRAHRLVSKSAGAECSVRCSQKGTPNGDTNPKSELQE